MSHFIDRAAALIEERRSQVCLGLDPVTGESGGPGDGGADPESVAASVVASCSELIEQAGPSCVAVKPQLARFEALGWRGVRALEEVCAFARSAGLLVVADGKRGDVPVSAGAYAEALTGPPPALGADATTVNPYPGADSLEPFVEAAARNGAGLFVLVRTSNPGAADLQDLVADGAPVHEHVAAIVGRSAARLEGGCGLTGMGAVVGATEPDHLVRIRDLLPTSMFLIPGVGAQGGRAEDLGPAFRPGRAGALVAASRSIADADDPAAAAEGLRATLWELSGAFARPA